MKRGFSVLLVVTTMLCMLPVWACALTVSVNDGAPIMVNDNTYWVSEEGSYAFEGDGNTQIVVESSGDRKILLTMNGVNLSGSWGNEGVLYIRKGNVLLNTIGKNSVKNVAMDASGVYIAEGSSLVITGDGELEASGEAKDINDSGDMVDIKRGYGYGVYSVGGSMSIESGTITAIGIGSGTEEGRGCGIYNNLGSTLTIKGGNLTMIGEGGGLGNGRGYGYGIWLRESMMKHENGMVTATGMGTASGNGFGVGDGIWNDDSTLTIKSGTITASGIGVGYGNGTGIDNNLGTTNILGGEVIAAGTAFGISNTGIMEIESGTVTAVVTGDNTEFGSGIHNTVSSQNIGTVNIHGGIVTANGKGNETDGISNGGNLTINNGTVVAVGAGKKADGIENGGYLTVKDGVVTATGTGDEGNGINIWRGTITIHGGKVMARGESTDDDGNGIYNDSGKLDIQGGIIEVSGEGTGRGGVGNGIYNFYGTIGIENGMLMATGIGSIGNGINNCVPSNYIRFGNVSNESVLNIGGGTIRANGTGKDKRYGLFNDGGTVYIQGENKQIYIMESEKPLDRETVVKKGEQITNKMVYEAKDHTKAHFMVETEE